MCSIGRECTYGRRNKVVRLVSGHALGPLLALLLGVNSVWASVWLFGSLAHPSHSTNVPHCSECAAQQRSPSTRVAGLWGPLERKLFGHTDRKLTVMSADVGGSEVIGLTIQKHSCSLADIQASFFETKLVRLYSNGPFRLCCGHRKIVVSDNSMS